MKQIYSYLRSAKAFPSRLERRQVSVETAVPGRTNSSDRSSPSPLNYLSASSFVDRALIARSLSPELIRSASETLPGKSVRKKRRRRRIGTGRATRRTFSSISCRGIFPREASSAPFVPHDSISGYVANVGPFAFLFPVSGLGRATNLDRAYRSRVPSRFVYGIAIEFAKRFFTTKERANIGHKSG